MPSSPLRELLDLPAAARAELAMALWASLNDADREGHFVLTEEQRRELDRRWAEHVKNPGSSVPWATLRARLLG